MQSPAFAAGGVDELVEEDLFTYARIRDVMILRLAFSGTNIGFMRWCNTCLCVGVKHLFKAIPPVYKGE